jgi:malate synthase
VNELLQRRKEVQARFDAGEKPDFLPETRHVSGVHVGAGVKVSERKRCFLARRQHVSSSGHEPSQHQGRPARLIRKQQNATQVREGDWKVAPLPRDLLDRRVEITGPTDRKMVINALNSGAAVSAGGSVGANGPEARVFV